MTPQFYYCAFLGSASSSASISQISHKYLTNISQISHRSNDPRNAQCLPPFEIFCWKVQKYLPQDFQTLQYPLFQPFMSPKISEKGICTLTNFLNMFENETKTIESDEFSGPRWKLSIHPHPHLHLFDETECRALCQPKVHNDYGWPTADVSSILQSL